MKKILLFLLISNFAYAKKSTQEILNIGTKEEQGYNIALEFDFRDRGFKHVSTEMEMVLRNSYGQEVKRNMRNFILENSDLKFGDKSIIIFDTPKDIKGTRLLSHAEILDPDKQWLFLPALKRVKRISSKNKSGPFLGSEFAYEDITGDEIGKYSWKFLNIEKCAELECFKLETKPKYEHSGYSKRIVFLDIEHFRLQKIEYYDRKDELLKTQSYYDYKQYLGKYWRADYWQMINHQTGKSTELKFLKYDFQNELSDNDFTTSALKRVR